MTTKRQHSSSEGLIPEINVKTGSKGLRIRPKTIEAVKAGHFGIIPLLVKTDQNCKEWPSNLLCDINVKNCQRNCSFCSFFGQLLNQSLNQGGSWRPGEALCATLMNINHGSEGGSLGNIDEG